MDIRARIAELRAWSNSGARRAAQLAAKDFDWWLREIESASTEGKRYCKDSTRVWYSYILRSNHHYCEALRSLLGEGFKVEIGTGYDSDIAYGDYSYDCVRVSW